MSAITKVYNNKETRGDIRVQKTFMVPLERIYMEGGFNIREHEQHNVERMAEAWIEYEQLPPVVVETQPNGTFKLIDGHRRYLGANLANERGEGITHLEAKECTAKGELDQLVYMVGTTQGVSLKSWELSIIAKRLHDLSLTYDEIGDVIDRGVSNVKHHIAVGSLPSAIFNLVKEGKIQDSLALEIHRKQGEQAVLDAVTTAGPRKVKRDDTQLWTPKTGKRAVEILSGADVRTGDDKVSMTLSLEEFQELQDAINKLKLESDNGQ
ncbi:putative DNA-binding protein [Vibrio phage 393E50-1]|nr:putative DNA-binding protein [Vibrio phage 393E50-1]